ncbi:MAG: hypothetical protein WCO56_23390 [Verrucomicrobiota bacterium]
MLTDAEFERRKPVWKAFSEFWLDTELQDEDLQRIANIAAASGYTVAELRDIYLYEVAPVVSPNLLTVAGEWAGFDEEWLCTEARKHAEHRTILLRFCVFIGIGRGLMTYATERHWHHIVTLLPTGKETKPTPGNA